MADSSESQVVKDVGTWEWSELLKKEDWLAVLVGFFTAHRRHVHLRSPFRGPALTT